MGGKDRVATHTHSKTYTRYCASVGRAASGVAARASTPESPLNDLESEGPLNDLEGSFNDARATGSPINDLEGSFNDPRKSFKRLGRVV